MMLPGYISIPVFLLLGTALGLTGGCSTARPSSTVATPVEARLELSGQAGERFLGDFRADGMTNSFGGSVPTNLVFQVTGHLRVEVIKMVPNSEILGRLTVEGNTVSISTSTAPDQAIRFLWQKKPHRIEATTFKALSR